MSNIDKYANFISNQQKTLKDDGKLISEREIVINRLIAEGYTAEQIEHILNEAGFLRRAAGVAGGVLGIYAASKMGGLPGSGIAADIIAGKASIFKPAAEALVNTVGGYTIGKEIAGAATDYAKKKTIEFVKRAAKGLTNQARKTLKNAMKGRDRNSGVSMPGTGQKSGTGQESNDFHNQG